MWVDGGVYNVNPLSDVLPHNPDLIIVIPTSPYPIPTRSNEKAKDWLDVGKQTFEIGMNRMVESDYNRFLDTNRLVRQVEALGGTAHNRKGIPLKAFKSLILSPEKELPGSMDFSVEAKAIRLGHADVVMRNRRTDIKKALNLARGEYA